MTEPLVAEPEGGPSNMHLERDLAALSSGRITEGLIQAEATLTGLPPAVVRESALHIVHAAAGRDVAGFTARRLVDCALADIDTAYIARYGTSYAKDPRRNVVPEFLDFGSKEGAARRKAWLDHTASARANLAEARKHYLHATILAQHVGREESATAKRTAAEHATPSEGDVHGPAADFVEAVASARVPKHGHVESAKQTRDLGTAIESAEAELASLTGEGLRD